MHRIGRTGRGGKTGLSHTLFTVADKLLAGPLGDVLRGVCVRAYWVLLLKPGLPVGAIYYGERPLQLD